MDLQNLPKAVFLTLIIGAALLLTACPSDYVARGGAPQEDVYFDLLGLLDSLEATLDSLNPRVEKTVLLNGQEETLTDTLDWKKELAPFRAGDINKPAYKGLYKKVSGEIDSEGKWTDYIAQRSDLKVRGFSIKRSPAIGLLVIDMTVEQDNGLYATTRYMSLSWRLGKLYRYSLEGSRKLVGFDSSAYSVSAQIVY